MIEYTVEEDSPQQAYRLTANLHDIALFPASFLAQEYHQRRELENAIEELNTHPIGSQNAHSLQDPYEVELSWRD